MIEVVAVVGPTASGKTAFAIELARKLGTEIISFDSMQFYRGMEIGSAAPTPEEQAAVPHHFVGFLPPDADFSAGEYERLAREKVFELNAVGKPAVAVGGSGLYLQALLDTLFAGPPKSPDIRERLQQEAAAEGALRLFERLKAVDPDYACVIHENDLRRIVRALEVYEVAGIPLSVLHRNHKADARVLKAVVIGLDWPRPVLYERINRRVDLMLEAGLVGEVQRLLDDGYEAEIYRLRTLGYREVLGYLRGECALAEAADQIRQNTRHYAKRQMTWFRHEPRVQWLVPEDRWDPALARAMDLVQAGNMGAPNSMQPASS